MLTSSDQLRARFAPNDPVRFMSRRRMVDGTIVRTNPKRAVIRVDAQEYTVPYERLVPSGDVAETREKRIAQIMQMALDEMKKYDLAKWRFTFDHSIRRAGCCNYREKTISISFELARNGTDADIRDTILHEIAHALVGRKHNHDAAWKATALEIGCSGERTHRLAFSPPRYHVRCENHCWSHTAQRRNRRLICRTCGGKLLYSVCM
jgi:predicted SprT family Zn-dependent metalloprotease